MPVWCTSCGSRLGPAGLPSRLRQLADDPELSTQAARDLIEAAQTIENAEPAVAKPKKWTTQVVRYRDPQNHPHEHYMTAVGRQVCLHCGHDVHETGCGR